MKCSVRDTVSARFWCTKPLLAIKVNVKQRETELVIENRDDAGMFTQGIMNGARQQQIRVLAVKQRPQATQASETE